MSINISNLLYMRNKNSNDVNIVARYTSVSWGILDEPSTTLWLLLVAATAAANAAAVICALLDVVVPPKSYWCEEPLLIENHRDKRPPGEPSPGWAGSAPGWAIPGEFKDPFIEDEPDEPPEERHRVRALFKVDRSWPRLEQEKKKNITIIIYTK